jgi:hypothetical protein
MFTHKQCAVVNAAFNVAKANYQSFPAYQVLPPLMQAEYRLAMANISRFATPSGPKTEQKGLVNCTQLLFNGCIGNIFFAIFWEAILDMGLDPPQCHTGYDKVVNHGVSQQEYLSMDEMREIALLFRRTAFFSAQAAGTKNNWDISRTTTTLDLKDKDLFATTVQSLVEKTRTSAIRFFNEPPANEVGRTELEEELEDGETSTRRRHMTRSQIVLDSDDEEEVERAVGAVPLPFVDFKDRIFTFDIGIVLAPVEDQLTFLSNGREADRIVARTCLFAREEVDESGIKETNTLHSAYVAPSPEFPAEEVNHAPFDGEDYQDYYHSDLESDAGDRDPADEESGVDRNGKQLR